MFVFVGVKRAASLLGGSEKKTDSRGASAKRPRKRTCITLILAGLMAAWTGSAMATIINEFIVNPAVPAEPGSIVLGPDGRYWFTEFYVSANAIGCITTNASLTTGTTVTNFPVPTVSCKPFGITVGADNNLWFTEFDGNKIGCMNTNGTMLGEFTVPTPASRPMGIIRGPDNNIWFVERDGCKIVTITNEPAFITNKIITTNPGFVEITNSTPTNFPCNLAVGPDGNIWFTETGNGVARIGRLNVQLVHQALANNQAPLSAAVITEFPLSNSLSQPFGIAAGPPGDGALWFTEYFGEAIGRIPTNAIPNKTNDIIEYPIPTITGAPYGITLGQDGNLWFAEYATGLIGRITPNGTNTNAVFAEFVIPSAFSTVPNPSFLATGPDGHVWFTEFNGDSIGQVADSPLTLTAHNYQFAAGTPFNNVVANFQDTDVSNALASSFSAAIKWGDGSTSAGVITSNTAGFNYFNVTGTHTYATPALYQSTVTVTDNDLTHDMGGATASVTNTFTVTSVNGRPQLGIQLLDGTNVVISWPASDTGFQPQAITNLVTGSNKWVTLAGTPVIVSPPSNPGQFFFEVTNRLNKGEVFYRLKK